MPLKANNYTYKNFYNEVPDYFSSDEECSPFNIKTAIHNSWEEANLKVLYIIEHVDSLDITAGKMGTHHCGDGILAIHRMARNEAKKHGFKKEDAIAITNFNFFKTYHLRSANKKTDEIVRAEEYSTKRALKIIKDLSPDLVIVVGDNAAQHISKNSNAAYLRGSEIGRVKDIPIYSIQAFYTAYSAKDQENQEDMGEREMSDGNLIWYSSRCVMNALLGKNPFSIDHSIEYVLVDTINKVNKLFELLKTKKIVSVDIETSSLARVTNTVYMIQFAFDSNKGFVIPFEHPDTPFSSKELSHIKSKLREFFSREFDLFDTKYDSYLIGQNFKFDLAVLLETIGLYHTEWPIWDIPFAEYALDENLKGLAVYGTPAFNLMQISLNYGITFYRDALVSKHNRDTLGTKPYNDHNVCLYAAADVCYTYAIHKKQLEKSKHIEHLGSTYYKEYKRFIVTQCSAHLLDTACMERFGTNMDMNYLFSLAESRGIIYKKRQELLKDFKANKEVQKANSIIIKREGGSSQGTLFENSEDFVFDLNKPDHKHVLFIEVMKLKPLAFGKTGPTLDKNFMKEYSNLQAVSSFQALSELDKLYSTYVKAYIKIRNSDSDFKKDNKMRASFGYNETYTGRLNSYDPNFQQIPEHGKNAKVIKRIFFSPPGTLKIKPDFNAHEVRGWGIMSGDIKIAQLFSVGRLLRMKYRETEDPLYKQLVDVIGDVHRLNAEFFFGIKPAAVTKPQRSAVKGVVFSVPYCAGAPSIGNKIKSEEIPFLEKQVKDLRAAYKETKTSENPDQKLMAELKKKFEPAREKLEEAYNRDYTEYAQDLVNKFLARFKKAAAFITDRQEEIIQRSYVTSPNGRRRNIHAHKLLKNSIVAASKRRAVNSPIQGFCSDLGAIALRLFIIHFGRALKGLNLVDKQLKYGAAPSAIVHDAIVLSSVVHEAYILAVHILQWSMSTGIMEYCKVHYGLEANVHYETGFSLGFSEADVEDWDWSDSSLRVIVKNALENQKKELNLSDEYVKDSFKTIFSVYKKPEYKKILVNYPILDTDPKVHEMTRVYAENFIESYMKENK